MCVGGFVGDLSAIWYRDHYCGLVWEHSGFLKGRADFRLLARRQESRSRGCQRFSKRRAAKIEARREESLDEEGNNFFENFVDRIAATLNKQWEENRCNEDLSKDDRHVAAVMLGLRSARTVMHVLYDQVQKRLNHRLA